MTSQLQQLRLPALILAIIVASALAAYAQTIDFTTTPLPEGVDKAPVNPGVAYIYDANAEASNGGTVRYSIRFGPAGLDVNEQTGVVSWQPGQEGEYDVEIRAELTQDPSVNATQTWKISVSKPQSHLPELVRDPSANPIETWKMAVSNLQTHPGCTGNEAWLPVGAGLPGPIISMASTGEDLYALHYIGPGLETGVRSETYSRLSKWNGQYWTTLNNRNIEGDSIAWGEHLLSYKGEIYRYASGKTIPNLSTPDALARWDGSSWVRVGESNFESIFDAVVVDDALYVLGFTTDDPINNFSLARWDGTNWQTIHKEKGGWGMGMASLNGKLYIATVAGVFGFTINELPILELDNGTLKPIENRDLDPASRYGFRDFISQEGSLIYIYSSSIGRCYRWDGTGVEVIEPPSGSALTRAYHTASISFGGKLYLAAGEWSGQIPSVATQEIWRLNGNEWEPAPALQTFVMNNGSGFGYLAFAEHKGELFSGGVFNQACGIGLNNVAVLGTDGERARISGSIFHDDTRNCLRDEIEPRLAGELVEITPGPFYAMTDATGTYNAMVLPGTYTVNFSPKTYWINSCPTPHEVTLDSPAAFVENIDFGTDMIGQINDVRVSFAGGTLRPGFDVTHTLCYWNKGTELASGKVTFEYDNRLVYKTSTQAPARQNGNVLEWDFSNLPVGASVSIPITFNVPASVQLGTRICALAEIELAKKDDDKFPGDNRNERCTEVGGSFDPNDIQVAPVYFDDEFDVAPLLPSDTVLTYFVRFQNTGTDTAFTVVVKDTLDPALLDITSIQLGAASHNYDFDISGSGILTWTFNNILLPDSNVNELASHGYFTYTVHLRKGLASMTEIPNRASIYFDYNEPVVTNTVVSVTSGTLSVGDDEARSTSLEIYPNPVQGTSSINLNLTEREHVSLRLVDSRGDLIAIIADRAMNAGEHTLSLNGRELSAGAYYLVLERGGEKEIYPVVINR